MHKKSHKYMYSCSLDRFEWKKQVFIMLKLKQVEEEVGLDRRIVDSVQEG